VANDEFDTIEPGVLAAVRRYWWLAIVGAVLFFGLALAVTALQPRPTGWTAEASLVVQDPSTSGLFANSYSSNAGRYVENQVAFLGSSLVAEQAATLASADAGMDVTSADITEWLTINGSSASDVIRLVSVAPTEAAAIASVNAVSQAYQDVRLSEAERDLKSSLDQLDSALAAANSRLSDIEDELGRLTESNDGQSQATAVSDLISKLDQLRAQRESTTGTARDNIDAEINSIASELGIYQTAQSIQYQDFTVSALKQEQSQLINQVSTLEQRRDELTVDSALSGSGVVLDSRAVRATPPPEPQTNRNAVLGTAFGLILGLGAAYFLALRRRRFDHRSQPETVLSAPLLATVTVPSLVEGGSNLPVLDAPESAAAEAHRFLAAALLSRSLRHRLAVGGAERRALDSSRVTGYSELPQPMDAGGDRGYGPVIAVVSASFLEGNAATIADTGVACMMTGADVSLVDAATDSPSVTEILRGGTSLNAIAGGSGFALLRMRTQSGHARLDVLTASDESDRSQWLMGAGVEATFDGLRSDNDVVLVDLPPVLSNAYASTILSAVDGAVVMVPHMSGVTSTEDLRDMLALVGTPIVGYVYVRRPSRALHLSGKRAPKERAEEAAG
jgi:Mrp family chromosome partitioning ATPase/archaellum component FlaC